MKKLLISDVCGSNKQYMDALFTLKNQQNQLKKLKMQNARKTIQTAPYL